jgi:6-phosphogluconolactonase
LEPLRFKVQPRKPEVEKMVDSASLIIEIEPSPDQVAIKVANWLLDLAMAAKERFTVSLSGGSTPKILYSALAQSPYKERFPWSMVHWFFGDERFVPKTDQLSNYKMVYEAMLSHVPVPEKNVHAVKTEMTDPNLAASDYERELKQYYGADKLDPQRPLFDVTFLGLGEDGHTASLFPGTAVLKERDKWASAVIGAKAEARITLTYPVIESSRFVAFLVTGAGKQEILCQLKAGNPDLPSAHVKPVGQIYWFLDEAAAQLLHAKT